MTNENIENTAEEKLRNWFINERSQSGLVDVRFFASEDSNSSFLGAVNDALSMVDDESSGRFNDITEVKI